MLTPKTLLELSPLPLKPKPRVILLYLTPRAYLKTSRRSAVRMAYRPTSRAIEPVRTSWLSPKDRNPMENQSGTIYWFQWGELACDEEYIGKTSRTFRERFKEHLKEPSPIHNHSCTTSHITIEDNFQIIGRGTMTLPEQLKNPSPKG